MNPERSADDPLLRALDGLMRRANVAGNVSVATLREALAPFLSEPTETVGLDVERLAWALRHVEDDRAVGAFPHFGPDDGIDSIAVDIASAYEGLRPRTHLHVYPWPEVKAHRSDGRRPRCRFCGEEQE